MSGPNISAWDCIAPGAFRVQVLDDCECGRFQSLLEASDAWTPAGEEESVQISDDRMTPTMLIYAEAVHWLVGGLAPALGDGVFGDHAWPAVVRQELRRGAHAPGTGDVRSRGNSVALTVLLVVTIGEPGPMAQDGGVLLTSHAGLSMPLTVPAGTAVAVDGSWTMTTTGPQTVLLAEYVRVTTERDI
ncbi:hypothetical protein ACIQWL_37435 [Streptomyces mirabilis]|uniref:hypothetical protein n=1 Tax=Streptomyces mirabilis TaxID=68239 RepID=UPI00382E1864